MTCAPCDYAPSCSWSNLVQNLDQISKRINLHCWWLTETTPEAREKIIQKLREAKEIAEKSRSENNS